MIKIRKSEERGHMRFSWLDTRHTFSFGEYYDPEHVGFRTLRVINEDVVSPGTGFGTHPHKDMEIITYVIDGAVQHEDSMGNGSIIRPGEVQRMTAGTGVTHSELNPSQADELHLLQIWILPEGDGFDPGYEQRAFGLRDRPGELCLVGSHDGREGSIRIQQDVAMYAGVFAEGDEVSLELTPGRHAWVQLVRGSVQIGTEQLEAGDGAALSEEATLSLRAITPAEVLVFDLA